MFGALEPVTEIEQRKREVLRARPAVAMLHGELAGYYPDNPCICRDKNTTCDPSAAKATVVTLNDEVTYYCPYWI
jgi:hypothetical protein